MKKILLYTLLCSVLAFASEHEHEEIHDHLETSSIIPNISLIMDVSYVNRNIEDDETAHLEILGIAHGILSSDSHYDEAQNQQEIDTITLQVNITIGHHKAHKMHDDHN